MTVRPATSGDGERIACLEADLFGTDAWSARTVAETLATRTVLVAEQGERLDGYVVLRVVNDVADLERIAVRPERQRSGLATDLLAQACAAAGADQVLLEVRADHAAAIAFYRRTGFTVIDRRRAYYRDGTDALVMCRGEVEGGPPTQNVLTTDNRQPTTDNRQPGDGGSSIGKLLRVLMIVVGFWRCWPVWCWRSTSAPTTKWRSARTRWAPTATP